MGQGGLTAEPCNDMTKPELPGGPQLDPGALDWMREGWSPQTTEVPLWWGLGHNPSILFWEQCDPEGTPSTTKGVTSGLKLSFL